MFEKLININQLHKVSCLQKLCKRPMTTPCPIPGISKITRKETKFETKWLRVEEVSFKDERGVERKWEKIARNHNQNVTQDINAVAVLGIVKEKNQPNKILLVKQFRPPIGKYTIEMPAGLIDVGETPETAALRELREETGYEGTIIESTPTLVLCPGIIDESLKVVHIEIDVEKNPNPIQQLEECENIEIILVEVSKLYDYLKKQQDEHDIALFDGILCFALGLRDAKKLLG